MVDDRDTALLRGEPALLDRCFAFASVEDGRLVSDLDVKEVYPTLEEAEAAAQEHVLKMEAEAPLRKGEGYWVFELQPVRFVGRPLQD